MSGCFLCSPNANRIPRKVEVSHLVMMWYDLSLFMPLSTCFYFLLWYCVFVAPCYLHLLFACLHFFFFFKVEVSPPMTGSILEEETVATLSIVFLGVEEEPPNGDIAEEAGQPMQGVQAVQDPEASQLPASQSP